MAVPFMGFPESVAATGHDVHYLFRLISIFLAFAPCYVLLTVSYEALFYGTFCWALFSWLLLEQRAHEANAQTRDAAGVTMDIGSAGPGLVDLMGSARRRTRLGTNDAQEPGTTGDEANDKALNGQLNQKGKLGSHRPLRFNDLRTSLVFLSFLIAAFFGTGNMASVSSFSMESVRRFQAVFDPFVMGALLIFRILVPYFALSAVFGILSQAIDLPPHALFFLTISTTDLMTLRFFFLVRDSGSWLEIGTSISHFVISSGLLVFNMILFGISSVLVNRIIVLGLPRPLKAKE